jgi:hypothetical protein
LFKKQHPYAVIIDRSNIVVFPNSELTVDIPAYARTDPKKTSSRKLVDEVNAGTRGLYLVGCIDYDDALQVHHWTSFCEYYQARDKTFSPKLLQLIEPPPPVPARIRSGSFASRAISAKLGPDAGV